MKGWVYKLYCKDLAIKEIYVGSSIDINARIRSHKNASHNPNNGDYNLKVYKYISFGRTFKLKKKNNIVVFFFFSKHTYLVLIQLYDLIIFFYYLFIICFKLFAAPFLLLMDSMI